MSTLSRKVAAGANDVIAWRREFHQFPELGFEEKRTSQRVTELLRQFGIEKIQTGIARYGVVAEIDSGKPGPTIGLRADMDALPIQEEVDCPFTSQHPGIMHACGHDAHTAMLLGAARILKQMADAGELAGKVRLLFQPCEEKMDVEGKSGGRRMVEEGAIEGLSAVIGQHISPAIEVGKLSFQSGLITAFSDAFELVVSGKNAHGATPHAGVDAIVISAAIIQAVQQIVSRRIDPLKTGVITIGSIHGGATKNIICDHVKMEGTIRSFEDATRDVLINDLRKISASIAEAMSGSAEFKLIEGYPAGVNDPALTAFVEAAVRTELGDRAIHPPIGPSTGAEDFAFMSRKVPGVFIRLGVKSPSWPKPLGAHKPDFQIDEASLAIGTAALVIAAREYLRTNS